MAIRHLKDKIEVDANAFHIKKTSLFLKAKMFFYFRG
ncbi:Uncharacterised protein [Myroides odoratus]|jgi:hypothetical protein|nr:hypothetical protein Myrod_1327 [Myroides odoratus DSM 2801]EKB09346.1 hypothetical protein HMPREF9716_00166 [Myroides odoratus CIP 103059]STZ29420.1 Uncharacterised protein [Myroides odoratus]